MKKKYLSLLSLLLAILMLSVACGEYKPAINEGSHKPAQTTEAVTTAPKQEQPATPFTVSLIYNGAPFVPEEIIHAQWNDGYSFYAAEIGADGTASVEGLDGDYRVTLSHLPEGYAYNPNIYTATNDFPHVEIELYELNQIKNRNTSLYKCISVKSTGFYHIQIEEPDDEIFFEFAPKQSGTYSIESMIDVTANDINPTAKYYGANAFFKQLYSVADDGGTEGVFTKNFKLDVEIADEMFSDTGQVVFSFGIEADAKSAQYPIDIYFAISLNGSYELDHILSDIILPTEPVRGARNYGSGFIFRNAEIASGGGWLFDGSRYAYWERGTGMKMTRLEGSNGTAMTEQLSGSYTLEFFDLTRKIAFTPESAGALQGTVVISEYKTADPNTVLVSHTYKYVYQDGQVSLTHQSGYGELDYDNAFTVTKNGTLQFGSGDGYYHLYDKENGTYGPILYAYVSQPFRFYDSPLNTIEYAGNKALTVSNGTENYKVFIEGFSALLPDPPGDSGPYFCTTDCPCRLEAACVGACTEECTKCSPDCRRCPEEAFDTVGYAQRCNADGVTGVTAELQDFLQKFSISQALFRDGNGFVETYPARQIYAAEDDQWLFACGYYERVF